MNERQFECVLTLAEEKSFSEAAKRLGISQPSLSQYIRKIEEECGNVLFERSLPLKLTYAGDMYVRHARNIISARKQMQNILADVSNEQAGKIVIGAGPLNSITYLPPIIAEYRKKWPKVEIVMCEFPEKELYRKAEEDAFDLVITTQGVDEKKFEYIPLFQEEMMLAVREDHPFCLEHGADGKGDYIVSAADCAELAFIEMDESFPIQKCLTGMFASMGKRPRYVIRCASIMTAYSLAAEGIGVMLLPSGAIKHGSGDRMRYYHLDPVPGVRMFGAYYPKGKYISKALQEFIGMLS